MTNARAALGHVTNLNGDLRTRGRWTALLCWPVFLFVEAACAGEDQPQASTDAHEQLPRPDAGAAGTPAAPNQIGGQSSPSCSINEAYINDRKSCQIDNDCDWIGYHPSCCDTKAIVGIARRNLDAAKTCAKDEAPRCNCTETAPERAEDGRVVSDLSTSVEVSCVAHRCVSSVGQRQCGKNKVCIETEICVEKMRLPGAMIPLDAGLGENAARSYECVTNPCPGVLSCECAQVACEVSGEPSRKCELERSGSADIACVTYND